jgi:hypothetical protein
MMAIEMMGVFQMAYAGLGIIQWFRPDVAALKNVSLIYALT